MQISNIYLDQYNFPNKTTEKNKSNKSLSVDTKKMAALPEKIWKISMEMAMVVA